MKEVKKMTDSYLLQRKENGLYTVSADGIVVAEDLNFKQAVTFIEVSMEDDRDG